MMRSMCKNMTTLKVKIEEEMLEEAKKSYADAVEEAKENTKEIKQLVARFETWRRGGSDIPPNEVEDILQEVGQQLNELADLHIRYHALKKQVRPILQKAKATVTALIAADQ